MHKLLKLKSGLRVVLVPVKDSTSVTVLKGYAVGSRQESDEIAGISHFIEHMMFKGTEKRPSAKQITKELDGVGAQYNAFTGKDMTAYYVKISAEKLELALDILSDMTYNSTFPAEEVEKERGVIVEEIKMYEDDPKSYVDDIYEQLAFSGNTLGRDIIGSRETVNAITREQMIQYRDKFYHDENSVLIICGLITENIEELLNKYFAGHPSAAHEPLLYEKFTKTPATDLVVSLVKKVEQAHFMLGFFTEGFKAEKSHVYSVFSAILGGGMSSVLFDELREKRGLCYYIKMYPSQYEDTGALVVRAGLNQEKLEEALEEILKIFSRYARGEFDDSEVAHAKDYLVGNLTLELEDTAAKAEMYLKRYLLTDKILTPQDRIEKIKSVTKDDIIDAASQVFTKDNLRLALISSKSHKKTLDEVINKFFE